MCHGHRSGGGWSTYCDEVGLSEAVSDQLEDCNPRQVVLRYCAGYETLIIVISATKDMDIVVPAGFLKHPRTDMTLHILQLILPEMVRAALKDAARPEPVAVLELPEIVASQVGRHFLTVCASSLRQGMLARDIDKQMALDVLNETIQQAAVTYNRDMEALRYLQPRHERDCWDPNCRGPIGTPMENLAKALARKPMMSTANFLEREHNRELPLRWPSFADWCFQDPYAHLDSMAPGLRTRPDISTSEALAIVREQLRAKFAAAVPGMLWRWPRVGYHKEDDKQVSTLVASSHPEHLPPGCGRGCLVWVARMDTLRDGIENGVEVAQLGHLRIIQKTCKHGATVTLAPPLSLPKPQARQ